MFWQIIFLLVVLIPLLAIVLDSQVGKAMAARLENGKADGEHGVLQERIRYLEGEVDRLATEVDRLADEGEFLHKLLAERPPLKSGTGRAELPGDSAAIPETGSEDAREAGDNED